MTAISLGHALINNNMLSLDPILNRWHKGVTHSKGIPWMITLTWCLKLGLAMLNKPSFKPLETGSLKHLTWKTIFLIVFTSTQDAYACQKPPFICFSSSGVTLFTNLKSLPKVFTTEIAWGPIHILDMHMEMNIACCLYVRRALNAYL